MSNGSKSLYLDIYRNGKRTYEYLKLYIIPETDENARKQNEAAMNAANKLKSKRIIEMTNGEAGIENEKEKVFLLDWMETYKKNQEKRGKKDENQIKVAIRIIRDYAGERMTLDRIDKAFCQGYIDYLLTEYRPRGKRVSNFTLKNYYRVLNPMKHEEIKHAYLFSCFCGLRISDVKRLKWKDVFMDSGQYRLAVSMKKTQEPIYLPLSSEALKWMPERGDKTPEDFVFELPSGNEVNRLLKPWAKAAGISKRFSYHTSRHTFATMMLTLGADLYTTSKLLGHADVRPCRCEDDPGVCQDCQQEKRRGGQPGKRIVRLTTA